jgi:hypothetical protein
MMHFGREKQRASAPLGQLEATMTQSPKLSTPRFQPPHATNGTNKHLHGSAPDGSFPYGGSPRVGREECRIRRALRSGLQPCSDHRSYLLFWNIGCRVPPLCGWTLAVARGAEPPKLYRTTPVHLFSASLSSPSGVLAAPDNGPQAGTRGGAVKATVVALCH